MGGRGQAGGEKFKNEPNENAFDKYNEILAEIEQSAGDRLMLLAVAPIATVLSFKRRAQGFQRIDDALSEALMDALKNAPEGQMPLFVTLNRAPHVFERYHFPDFFATLRDFNMLRVAVCAFEDAPESAFESLAPFLAQPNHREKPIFFGESPIRTLAELYAEI